MRTLHILNPEHDIALAHNDPYFTAPHAGRCLRADLGFLPVLWANDGDLILVEDVEMARERIRHLKGLACNAVFVTSRELSNFFLESNPNSVEQVSPWGWDITLCHQLQKMGVPSSLLPTHERLNRIREVSGRAWLAKHLQPNLSIFRSGVLQVPQMVTSVSDIDAMLSSSQEVSLVLKSPWSSSGRGVRYVSGKQEFTTQLQGWVRKVIAQQGCVMVEPYYMNKVKDFAMEFFAHDDGHVSYEGLSLFRTVNGAYDGNIVATEEEKTTMMARYMGVDDLKNIAQEIIDVLQPCLQGVYTGPFGVDMMLLSQPKGELQIHPCVELNLRRTMGHVALAASRDTHLPQRLLRIEYTGRYHLRLKDTNENLLNTGLARL